MDARQMERLIIRQLAITDAEAVLGIELENPEWFEAHIEARLTAFYRPEGAAAPCVLCETISPPLEP
jgi:hypothetical protein